MIPKEMAPIHPRALGKSEEERGLSDGSRLSARRLVSGGPIGYHTAVFNLK